MCGLFGVVSKNLLSSTEIEITRDLATVSQLRGLDSAGICVLLDQPKGHIKSSVFRTMSPAAELFVHPTSSTYLNKERVFAIAGHTRLATVGSVNKDNAHPFSFGNLIGMQNGSAPEFHPPVGGVDEPDSKALFRYMSEHGLDETLKKMRGAAFALCWFDTKKKTLNFIRNSDRPLYFMDDKAAGTIFWASEFGFLDLVRSRHWFSTFAQRPELPTLLPPLQHVEVNLYSLESTITDKTSILFPPKEDSTPNWWPTNQGAVSVGTPLDDEMVEDESGEVLALEKGDTDCAALWRITHYQGFRDKNMSKEKAGDLLRCGCAHCTEKPPSDRPLDSILLRRAHFFDYQNYLCDKCVKLPNVLTALNIKTTYEGTPVYEKKVH